MNDINIFYKNKKGEIEYNEMCKDCKYSCKQSFRAKIVTCKNSKKKGKK